MEGQQMITQQLKRQEEMKQKELEKEFKYYIKEYELYENNKKYKLTIELSNGDILFTLELLSEISCYNYINKYILQDLIKELDLSIEINNENLKKIFDYFDSIFTKNNYKIINDNKFKKLIINNRELISLNENLLYNHDIIKNIINEINIIKETNNKLIKLNEEKDNKIKNLESKYKSLKDDLNNIITSNDLIVKKELTLVYECENESLKNIFGEKFVSENKANLELIIDGKKWNLKINII